MPSTTLLNRTIPYTLKVNARSKRVRLAVYPDATFVVTAPRFVSIKTIEKFIQAKAQWIIKKIDYFSSFSYSHKAKDSKAEYLQYKEQARKLAYERIEHYNAVYRFTINSISIRNQKTRWGSCSKKGNLNFNYKIALIPQELSDYIIVHELCHLGQFNHSAKFWKLVAQTIPHHLALRKELKKNHIRYS